ncbi:MAG: class II aldolase/adducin family protein [Halobacteriota archaeon]
MATIKTQALLLKKEIAEYMALSYKRGLTSSLGGNISVRAEQVVFISPTKVPRYRIRPDDVAVVTMMGEHLEGKNPSSELPTHLAIYKATEYSAIVHAHSRFATVLSCLGNDLESPDVEGKHLLGRVPLIPYEEPGTADLGEAVSRGILGCNGVLLQNHGLIAIGANIEEAFIVAEAIERAAELIFDLSVLNRL